MAAARTIKRKRTTAKKPKPVVDVSELLAHLQPNLTKQEALRAELDRIETFLMGPHGRALADVLAALRGPDHASLPWPYATKPGIEERTYGDHVKSLTTVAIRRAAFPRLAAQHDKLGNVTSDGTAREAWDLGDARTKLDIASVMAISNAITNGKLVHPFHFYGHIRHAAIQLGLWEE